MEVYHILEFFYNLNLVLVLYENYKKSSSYVVLFEKYYHILFTEIFLNQQKNFFCRYPDPD